VLDHADSPGDPFNVGALNELSINQLAELIVSKTGSSSRVVHIPYEEAYEEGFEDMERRVPDIGRIRALTGWEPTRTMDDILNDVIAFERGRPANPS
jgi:UDP-glucose 4-epimerase